MARSCVVLAVLCLTLVLGSPRAGAQGAASGPDVRGHVVDKKKLAECKAKAKEQKLRHGKRRKFMRACAES